MEFLSTLLNPKILGVLTPAGVIIVTLAMLLFKLVKKYDAVQEKRLLEWKQMKDEYMKLSIDINKTLDLLIQTITSRRNGNGSRSSDSSNDK